MQTNNLLAGKNNIQRIVSIECKDSIAELFIQQSNGEIKKETFPTTNWFVTKEEFDSTSIPLKGDLPYKFIRFMETDREFFGLKKVSTDIFSISNSKERCMVYEGFTYFKGLKHNEVSVLSFDIETTTLEHNKDAKILLIANTFRKNGNITKRMFCYDEFLDQGEMLKAWCKWVKDIDPSIITGHNIDMYDLPYISFIAEKEEVKLSLGRNNSSLYYDSWESKFRKDSTQFYHYHKPKIYGREIIDTLFLSLKYDVGRKYENYKLKNIIQQEGLEKKNRTFYDAGQIRNKYQIQEEWSKIKAYAQDDGDDALALYDLMSPPFFYSAQIIPKSYQLITESAEGSKINSMMIRSYLQEGYSLPEASEKEPLKGAISLGNPGIYKNVFKVDVASLYPSIMIQYGVYDPLKDPNANFLTIVKELTQQRLENKKKAKETGDSYYSGLEQSQKVLINSAYGFLSTTGLIFNSPEKAAFITATGREILETAIGWCKDNGFKLVNADTDSISFSKGNETFISKEERGELLKSLNSLFPERIRFEDDGYYTKLIVLGPKNYILQTEDNKIKIKGSSLKDQKKEPALLEFIQVIINSILEEKYNYLEIYSNYIKEILNITDIKRWSSKKSITEKVLNGTRTNETKIKDAIKDSEYKEGDKAYMFFDEDDTLKLVENFKGSYNKNTLLKKLYKTSLAFETVIPKETFLNYSLKRSKKLLEEVNG